MSFLFFGRFNWVDTTLIASVGPLVDSLGIVRAGCLIIAGALISVFGQSVWGAK